jgi:hypothetical protein
MLTALQNETLQVQYLLHCLVSVIRWHQGTESHDEHWTPETVKDELREVQATHLWWSDNESSDKQLQDIRAGKHWMQDEGGKARLVFDDTDERGWSAVAANLITKCGERRIYVMSDGDENEEMEEGRYLD